MTNTISNETLLFVDLLTILEQCKNCQASKCDHLLHSQSCLIFQAFKVCNRVMNPFYTNLIQSKSNAHAIRIKEGRGKAGNTNKACKHMNTAVEAN